MTYDLQQHLFSPPTFSRSLLFPDAARVAMNNFPGFIAAGDENYSVPKCETSVTTGIPGRHRKGKDLSTFTLHSLHWGLHVHQPSLCAQLLPQHIFVLWVDKNQERQWDNFSQEQKNWRAGATSRVISKYLPTIGHLIKYNAHQEPALSSTTFSG